MKKVFNFWLHLEMREATLGKLYYFGMWLRGQVAFLLGLGVSLLISGALPDPLQLLHSWFVFNGLVVGVMLLLEYALYKAVKRFFPDLAEEISKHFVELRDGTVQDRETKDDIEEGRD